MLRKTFLAVLVLLVFTTKAQRLSIQGTVQDTAAKQPLQNAVITVIKLGDSTMIEFTRSNEKGFFEIKEMPIDTYKVVISYRKFGDKILYVIGSAKNYEVNFNNIIMPPNSVNLDEVTIFAYKDPVYYKGDTLIYTADSFKVKPNATVEDLLKKLPGVKVDAKGKITAQGKEVSKVLVDGDEFFGADPTMATKNLAANSVESIQVYEKKDENASADNTSDETIKVMNLKLKDDAKKGYFGKVAAGSDGQKFYESSVLLNKFRNKQKISVFALGANTPKTGFGWNDVEKYGLDNERDYSWNEDNNNFSLTNDQGQGIPRTLNTGIYYNDKLSKKTKINSNYSYKNNLLVTESTQRSQYFLKDTNYITNNVNKNTSQNQNHTYNLTVTHEIDSLTKITLTPKITYNVNNSTTYADNNFATTEGVVSRETQNNNSNLSTGYDVSSGLRLNRSFKKKDRTLNAFYSFDYANNTGSGLLQTINSFYTTTVSALNNIDQKKESSAQNLTHNASIIFFEPFTKKIKSEVTYEYTYNANNQYKKSLNKLNEDYSLLDSVFSNNFTNSKLVNQVKARLIYEIKKYRISIGTRVRQVSLINTNNYTNKVFKQNVNNILPFVNYNYNFSQNQHLSFNYNTNSQQPSINQLQPLQNNANQNFITLGNPNLRPTFAHQFNMNFNSYKPISGKYIWLGGNYVLTQNAFSSNLVYDSIGRSISTATNVNGNYTGSFFVGGNLPLYKRILNVSSNLNTNLYSNNNIINNQKNTTKNTSYSGNLQFTIDLDKYYFDLGSSYDYNIPYSTVNSQNNKAYTTQQFSFMGRVEFPKKIFIESDANYNINSKRTNGYNINYCIVNASLYKNFGKLENFILAIKAYDIFNQNIVANRQVYNNIITDSKTKIITRYFLLNITYKFNSQKTKEEGRED